MRYYRVVINSDSERIVENTAIHLKDYGYYNTNVLMSVNWYFYQNLKNDIFFLVHREEENGIYAGLAFNEKRYDLDTVYGEIRGLLKQAFGIDCFKYKPVECTMLQFEKIIAEAKRRDLITFTSGTTYFDMTRVYSHFFMNEDSKNDYFSYNEKIIPDEKSEVFAIYDKAFVDELINIESHKIDRDRSGNIVHYIISARSNEACNDLVITLSYRLYLSGRIKSKRIGFVRDIRPDIHRSEYIEKVIGNNIYGTVVINLSERFGYEPTKYTQAILFLEELIKRYRNDCLFIFTYNLDHPGFSYGLLPNLKKYVIPMRLREGTGDRKAAVSYMKSLIKASEYAEYASQAATFLKRYPGSSFTQSDVLLAYEQFEPWCLNKNILQAYDYDLSDDFMLDRDENIGSAEERLNKLIGLQTVKSQIKKIVDADVIEKERKKRTGHRYNAGTMHMIFAGNPGSAKTTVAKLFGEIAKEKGILKSGIMVERCGVDLNGMDCVDAIREAFDAAKGGVLFIDEAYGITGQTATTVILKEMEEHRDEVIVILAGYSERMKEFINLNEGLKSRIPFWIEFPDYDENELTEIFKLMLGEKGFKATEEAIKQAHHIFEKVCRLDDFGNGRYARNLLEKSVLEQSERIMAKKNKTVGITQKDLFLLEKADIKMPEDDLLEERAYGTAKKELDEMIGLSLAKQVIRKAVASFKYKRLLAERGVSSDHASYHMVFTGNPGTAKTTVARLFAEILKDERILPTGQFIEVGRADLIGNVVGSTAPLVKKRFKEAQGGVLFIDEAYSLCDGFSGGYGDEAINTIIQEMENHRDDVIVIFAGYPKEMKEFLERNPGMASRIAFYIDFEDYSVDELCDITRLMVKRKKIKITDTAMTKLKEDYEQAVKQPDYGNGRYVRNILEEAEMNLAMRIFAQGDPDISTEALTTIEACDIPDNKKERLRDKKQPIGFYA